MTPSEAVDATAVGPRVRGIELQRRAADPRLDVMGFLNEAVLRYPQAVSFAPGRPLESDLDVVGGLQGIERYAESAARRQGRSYQEVLAGLGQYGPTNGIVREEIATHLEVDEGIVVTPESVMLTCGCQEALSILLLGLFERDRDVLLVSDPSYIGITGMAHLLGIPVQPVAAGGDGLTAAALAEAVRHVRSTGRRPRCVYDVPDFNNPLGTSVPLDERHRLLELAAAEDFLIVEDGAYRAYCYETTRLPTLKSLDEAGRVVYLGSFSKTLFPGLRLGYLVADMPAAEEADRPLAAALARVKSLTTVNTSPLLQAAAAGFLAAHGHSLQAVLAPRVTAYRQRRDSLLAALEDRVMAAGLAEAVRWNRPRGGFFVTVRLPFAFDEGCLRSCAEHYGVLVSPMSYFSLLPGREDQVRLSFSYVTPPQIELGVERFVRFVRDRASSR